MRYLFRAHCLYVAVGMNAKLFRAIVVMGVSLTATSCDDSKCHRCSPPVDSNTVADAKPTDAGIDTPAPSDAPVDTVLIL